MRSRLESEHWRAPKRNCLKKKMGGAREVKDTWSNALRGKREISWSRHCHLIKKKTDFSFFGFGNQKVMNNPGSVDPGKLEPGCSWLRNEWEMRKHRQARAEYAKKSGSRKLQNRLVTVMGDVRKERLFSPYTDLSMFIG